MHPDRTVLAILALLLAACGRPPAAPAGPPPPPEVAFVTAGTERIVLTTVLPGRTAACLLSEVKPQVSGLIVKREFREGADVKAGDVLYRIDPAAYQAAYDGAAAGLEAATKGAERARAALAASLAGVERQKAALALANLNRRRVEDLVKSQTVPVAERDQAVTEAEVAEAGLRAAEALAESDRAAIAAAEATIHVAESAVKTAQVNLDYTRVTAPISGRIGRSHVTEGAYVAAYQAILTTIQMLDPIFVDVPRSTVELNRLRLGAKGNGDGKEPVRIVLEDGTPYPHAGTLEFGDVTVDPTTGSVILRILVPNPDGVLLPGMFVRAILEEAVVEDAILVPQQGVSRDPRGNPQVLVVGEDGKVVLRPVKADRAIGDRWLVSSGLAAGDRVIVEGVQRARPGAVVKPVPFETKPAPAPGAR